MPGESISGGARLSRSHRPCSLLAEESKQQMLGRPTPEVLAMLPWIALVETKLV